MTTDNFLGNINEWVEFGLTGAQKRLKRYRRYVYEAGALNRGDRDFVKVIDNDTLENERQKNYAISRIDRFRSRTRYFTDSGIIGTKEFVSEETGTSLPYFHLRNERLRHQVKGAK